MTLPEIWYLRLAALADKKARFHFADDLLLESRFEFPSLLSHRSTPCGGPILTAG